MERKPKPPVGKTVGNFLPKIARKAFEKHGFAAATLITDWAQIVGRDMAAVTEPERLKWPRPQRQTADATGAAPAALTGRPSGTLMLRVDPAAVLEVQYQTATLTERINRYFGYRAVESIKLIQAPAKQDSRRPARTSPTVGPARPRSGTAGIAEHQPGLEGALARLAASVGAERQKSGRA